MTTEERFRQAIAENGDRIYRICGYYYQCGDDRNDAYQESLIRIWETIGSFRNKSKVSTWIYRVVVNTCLTGIRKEKRRNGLIDHSKAPEEIHIADIATPEADRLAEQKVDFFRRFMQQLPGLDRMLVSIYLEDLDTREMAEITGLSEANVRVKIHRIKEMIKKGWEESEHGTR
jgi:RNA polymerase sigma-70 factor (ECF subfamily)